MFNSTGTDCSQKGSSVNNKSIGKMVGRCVSAGVGIALSLGLVQPAAAITFRTDWTGQILGYRAEGAFSYDENQTYADGIVRRNDLTDFDISFYDPAGDLIKTFEDNYLTYDGFNFNFDTRTREILQDGYADAPNGIEVVLKR